ncbi:Ion channel family [Ketogulonicigenium robustum]|uniref:Ion channel family n=1 Tax=Ketogulonicigenium robustum TaxID=92947 RepID=A0A1W6P0W0_9RHOB|nr:potassium channel family protein [Ketogulonicigenium robustum]ARO15145.1 Ion channel family [Ketogulonicigenium robustum]
MVSFWLSALRLLKAILRAGKSELFRGAFFLTALILLSGTLFYHGVEGWSWVDSLYFSVMTISTIGTADMAPTTDFSKLFTIVYVFVGVGAIFALFALIARALIVDEPDEKRTKSEKKAL